MVEPLGSCIFHQKKLRNNAQDTVTIVPMANASGHDIIHTANKPLFHFESGPKCQL